ncbi:hypothetical protein BJP40_28775 [Streptomyces sp. CC53]|uniref:hypothetical protein n=1 Tax=unclassified Streptomyces TaxID=2593676 RepID=UPI0008DE05A5|nr:MULTISPECIES: hypothetical protein [unclassified Streptomyces]OII62366.1 hypothetical protein BJP40_28775 [Streptomyces sp. CC53]
MPASPPPLPPVRLPSDAVLARDALAAPLLTRAVRLARWAGPATRVGAGGELVDAQLAEAASVLGLPDDEDGEADASEAWRVAVDTGLVTVRDPEAGAEADEEGTVEPGGMLPLVTGGAPRDVLGLWLDGLETVCADAATPFFDDPEALTGLVGEDGEIDFEALDWDPEAEAEFLDGVLANLYLLTVAEGGSGDAPVPLPALAASMVVPPDDMGEPSDAVLEQVSEVMMRLDDQFRLLEPMGVVEYRPVDEALLGEDAQEPDAGAAGAPDVDDEDVARYGLVRLTPLGLYGIRSRLLESGVDAPAVGDLAERDAAALLTAVAAFPQDAARAETELWLARRAPLAAARELLAGAKGADAAGPLRRLHCQQALALVGADAEPAVREVLDDPELGGLARVWLVERGASSVPAPPEEMVFWLTVDTIAAQLAADGDLSELTDLIEGLTGRHSGFFEQAWRVDHPATAEVLEAVGRLHRDRRLAKDARKAAFKARSRA